MISVTKIRGKAETFLNTAYWNEVCDFATARGCENFDTDTFWKQADIAEVAISARACLNGHSQDKKYVRQDDRKRKAQIPVSVLTMELGLRFRKDFYPSYLKNIKTVSLR